MLLQAGVELAHLTGTALSSLTDYLHRAFQVDISKGGMHEVVVSDETLAAVKTPEDSSKCMWSVNSTPFAQDASDEPLAPIGKFNTQESSNPYPSTLASEQVAKQLKKINLHLWSLR